VNKYRVDYVAHGVEQSETTVKAVDIAQAIVNVNLWFGWYYKGIPNVEILGIQLVYESEEYK
jgi:hypothetical protein